VPREPRRERAREGELEPCPGEADPNGVGLSMLNWEEVEWDIDEWQVDLALLPESAEQGVQGSASRLHTHLASAPAGAASCPELPRGQRARAWAGAP